MSGHLRAIQERRRSNAAGPHGRRPTRAEELEAALADEDDLSTGGYHFILDGVDLAAHTWTLNPDALDDDG